MNWRYLTIFLLIFLVACTAQVPKNAVDIPNRVEWKVIDADGMFSFEVPASVEKEDVQGIDSYVGRYKDNNLVIEFDYGMYSSDLGKDDSTLNYKTAPMSLHGVNTTVVEYDLENDERGTHMIGLVVPSVPENENARLMFSVYSKSDQGRDDALRIIKSIKFSEAKN